MDAGASLAMAALQQLREPESNLSHMPTVPNLRMAPTAQGSGGSVVQPAAGENAAPLQVQQQATGESEGGVELVRSRSSLSSADPCSLCCWR